MQAFTWRAAFAPLLYRASSGRTDASGSQTGTNDDAQKERPQEPPKEPMKQAHRLRIDDGMGIRDDDSFITINEY